MLEESLGSLVKILGEGNFPERDPFLKTSFDVDCFELQSTNLMGGQDLVDLILEAGKLFKFLLELFQLWVRIVEFLKHLVNLFLPEPVKFLEALQELDDIVLCSLDGTCQEQDDLNDFLVLGDPVIERLSKFLWLVLLVPILNILGRLQNMTSSSVDGMLDLLERWLECASISLKMNIDLEEWLQDLLWHVSSSTNSLLHLI